MFLKFISCFVVLAYSVLNLSLADSTGCNVNLNDIVIKWYQRPLGDPLETRKGLSDLTEAYKIEIVNQSVAVLCRNSVKDLENLYDLDLSYNGMQELQPEAFSNVGRLRDLHLNDNQLEGIKSGVFNQLGLSILRLQNNHIEHIEPSAFDNMRSLRILNLSNNRIKAVTSEWFKNSSTLHQLNLENNLITSLGEYSFKNLIGKQVILKNTPPVILNIDLSNNKISHIDSKAFDGLGELGVLSLDENLIENVHEDTFSDLKRITSASLMFNKIKCLPIHVHHILKADVSYLENNPWDCECVKNLERQVKRKRLNVHVTYDVLKCKIAALSSIVKDVIAENE